MEKKQIIYYHQGKIQLYDEDNPRKSSRTVTGEEFKKVIQFMSKNSSPDKTHPEYKRIPFYSEIIEKTGVQTQKIALIIKFLRKMEILSVTLIKDSEMDFIKKSMEALEYLKEQKKIHISDFYLD